MSNAMFPPDPERPVPVKTDVGYLGDEPRPSRPDDEIRRIALDVSEGRVFGSWMVERHDARLLPAIFMPLSMLDDLDHKRMKRDGTVHFFANMVEATPRGVNGYPCFFSLSALNADEAKRLSAELERLRLLRAAFLNGEEDRACPA